MNSTTRIFSTVLAKRKWLLLAIVAVLACLWIAGFSSGAKEEVLPEVVDYNFHIRPILSDKCYTCHGPDANKREAGLRLDEEMAAKAELSESPGKFAIVAGDISQSELVHRIWTADENELMPPPESNLKLTERERRLLQKWIEEGAEFKQHWAYIAPQKEKLPEVKKTSWVKNEIDPFVLQKLDELGLAPNPMADKERLLKRAAFDLTGLPPGVDMQDRFLADEGSDAYEKVLDELMESKHYGEKMALHWLDVARYADSHGYQDDGLRTMWPWRDWVIHAFNENYSYEKFLTWQLAGDLLPDPNKEMLLATGFNRNHKITQEGGVIDEEYRIEYVTDRTNTFGKAFLGLTYECAKCHDHKYDPISQQNYFEAFAFFNQVPEKGLFGTIDANFADPPNMQIKTEDVEELLHFVNKKDSMPVKVMIMQDSVDMRTTHILDRGNYDSPTTRVKPFMPEFIFPFDSTKFEQNRLGLAKWLLADEHPLTARVFVNRIWQEIFGTGIVKSSGDFGMQGDLPTHLELLDYLAVDFRESGWDIKALMKKILMSATYMQSSETDKRKLERDPDNLYFSRFPRRRLNAEFVKDHVLASSGLLNPEIGGPSVKPYQPDGIWESATSGRGLLQTYIQDHGNDLYRRGMYTFIKRTVPPPSMLMFDASNRDQCEVRRLQTNTPLQALVMLNDPHSLEASRVLAEKLMQEAKPLDEMIQLAFRQIVCRKVKAEELEVLQEYYKEMKTSFEAEPQRADSNLMVGEYPRSQIEDVPSLAALMQVIHTIYNLEESISKT